MPSLCLYFQVHQPYRIRPFHLFEIGGPESNYFDQEKNREICLKVASKCYIPANDLLLKLIQKYPRRFKVSFSITGLALEQFTQYAPEVLESFQRLAATGQVEFLSETYYHSLSSLFDQEEFREQVHLHQHAIHKYFQQLPSIFRNTELIFSNEIAQQAKAMGFKAVLAEGADWVLAGRSPNFLYQAAQGNIPLLLKNYRLSDDIAFRFSQKSWSGWPLTAAKYAHWIHSLAGRAEIINLFMDYETIGEHQWEDTGIFQFLEELPEAIFRHPDFDFATPSEIVGRYRPVDSISVSRPVSWADTERDVSAWLGNPMQDSIIAWLYRLGPQVKKQGGHTLLHTWRKLQTSDHFYYMCTKYWNDGDVHKYFSSFSSPHESYTILNNILTDLDMYLNQTATRTTRRKSQSSPKSQVLAKILAKPTVVGY